MTNPPKNPIFLEHLTDHPIVAERYARLLADPRTTEADVSAFIEEITERARLGRMFPIELVDPKTEWPGIYEAEASRIREVLPRDVVVCMEHYGSTAIPGISAKDIVDILLEVTSFEAAEKECVPVLEKLGYAWNWYNGHIALFKGYQDGSQRFHIHMATTGHDVMDGLLFRDYLRAHPEDARRYEELKRDLATRFRHDREEYTSAKSDFCREIVEKAKADQAAL